LSNEITIAIIAASGSLGGVLSTLAFQSIQQWRKARTDSRKETEAAQVSSQQHFQELLVAACEKLMIADREWAKERLEFARKALIAEERLRAKEADCAREAAVYEQRIAALLRNPQIAGPDND